MNEGERRHGRSLSAEELEEVKTQVLESIYADIGKSVVKKILWVGGACGTAFLAWLTSKGHITIGK